MFNVLLSWPKMDFCTFRVADIISPVCVLSLCCPNFVESAASKTWTADWGRGERVPGWGTVWPRLTLETTNRNVYLWHPKRSRRSQKGSLRQWTEFWCRLHNNICPVFANISDCIINLHKPLVIPDQKKGCRCQTYNYMELSFLWSFAILICMLIIPEQNMLTFR